MPAIGGQTGQDAILGHGPNGMGGIFTDGLHGAKRQAGGIIFQGEGAGLDAVHAASAGADPQAAFAVRQQAGDVRM